METIYQSATNCSNVLASTVSLNHDSPISIATIECKDTSLTLGDEVTLDIGYVSNHAQVFIGYVKQIDRKVPSNTYSISAYSTLVRAQDFFIASTNPEEPLSYQNISAEGLVSSLLALPGLTSFTSDATSFVFGINGAFEINLVNCLDYAKQIADLLTWSLWSDENGTVHFENRKPYVMVDEYPENEQLGFEVDVPTGYVLQVPKYTDIQFTESERALRNRVVIYGGEGIYGEAKREVSILPDGFYKSAALAFPQLIDDIGLAENIAEYNLSLFCRTTQTIVATIVGDVSLKPRTVIGVNIPRLGLSGNWYVYSVDHNVGDSGYTTSLSLRRMVKAT
jgi:hypothetical protein